MRGVISQVNVYRDSRLESRPRGYISRYSPSSDSPTASMYGCGHLADTADRHKIAQFRDHPSRVQHPEQVNPPRSHPNALRSEIAGYLGRCLLPSPERTYGA